MYYVLFRSIWLFEGRAIGFHRLQKAFGNGGENRVFLPNDIKGIGQLRCEGTKNEAAFFTGAD